MNEPRAPQNHTGDDIFQIQVVKWRGTDRRLAGG